jgi:thymidylate synthase (FAD)
MRITEAGFTILPTPHTQAEILKHIERCGRVCYKSEDKITEDSAQQFIANIIKRGHEAVLEHGSLCVRMPQIMESLSRRTAVSTEEWYAKAIVRMESHYDGGTLYRNYLRFFHDGYKTRPVISGNIRAWRSFFKAYQEQLGQIPLELHSLIQLNTVLLGQFLPYAAEGTGVVAGIEWPEHLCTSARLVHQDVSVLFTVDRGISHEIVRHRLVVLPGIHALLRLFRRALRQ